MHAAACFWIALVTINKDRPNGSLLVVRAVVYLIGQDQIHRVEIHAFRNEPNSVKLGNVNVAVRVSNVKRALAKREVPA